MILMFGFNLSIGPITWLYIAELLPPKGCTITSIINLIFVFFIGLSFPFLYDTINIQGNYNLI